MLRAAGRCRRYPSTPHPSPHFTLCSGVCLIKLSRPGEALEHLGRCVELDGTYVKGYLRRAQAGVAMDDKEHIEGAIRDYNRAKECVRRCRPRVGGHASPRVRPASPVARRVPRATACLYTLAHSPAPSPALCSGSSAATAARWARRLTRA